MDHKLAWPHGVIATAPSNIAFLKYWGKSDKANQWPANSSMSMTLDALKTTTKAWHTNQDDHQVLLGGKTIDRTSSRGQKVFRHLDYLKNYLGAKSYLLIESQNSFPADCGIASSASGIAALTIAACASWLGKSSFEELDKAGFSTKALAQLARQGSGSACRSFFGGFVTWHKGPSWDRQSFTQDFTANHWRLDDTVVMVSAEEKAISSSLAHELAWSSLLFEPRLASLEERLGKISKAIATCNLTSLGELLEQEALEMHAVIMTGKSRVSYLTPKSVEILAWLRYWRKEENLACYFTIDAGPNIHILSEPKTTPLLKAALGKKFPELALLSDSVGEGPTLKAEK